MANSSNVLTSTTFLDAAGSLKNSRSAELLLSWVGDDANGTVPTVLMADYESWTISKVISNPGAVAPTALYDITFVDTDGLDILDGAIINRSATLSEVETMAVQVGADGFTVTIANQLVNSATGIIRVFLNR
jgi:hypothetical protein